MNGFSRLEAAGLTVHRHAPLAPHTTLRLGGPADALVWVPDFDRLRVVAELSREVPVLILGRGSNVLISDAGFRGVVALLSGEFDQIRYGAGRIEAGAAVALPRLAKFAARHGISGLEFALGVPGSVGGGLIMNAGAWGQQMSDTVCQVEVMTHAGERRILPATEAGFRYRDSDLGRTFAVTRAWFEGTPADPETVARRMQDLYRQKVARQPFAEQTAGCLFKNPPGDAAGRLIEACGLKGFRRGGLEISSKHANFLIHHGGATAAEAIQMIRHIQRVVRDKTGHLLELEVKLIGFSAE